MTPGGSTEREIKLTVAGGGPGGPGALLEYLARLPALGAAYALGPARAVSIRDVYYDTAGGRLRAGRVAFRIRNAGGRPFVTVKRTLRQESGLSVREEYEAPLEPESLREALQRAGLPAGEGWIPVAALAAGDRAGPLLPVLVAATERVSREVRRGALVVATLSLDRVRYERVPGEPVYHDVEVEATPAGTEADLEHLGRLLARAAEDAGARLVPERESKLSRGLRLLGAVQ
ncbi:CYTH domain-containing protein [Caldinitratiruptor microaerophilus]|uniref:CYTH domain-containing protein n=1 Tax=Caldinitratiruptor microaerophilus TaxID=671077 RepID=A0AA35CLJ7_9FIRM|nr:CYTH domain-containing protein [Caldinitratiruptor microaerophilus]BDG61442.1 hypothetical protein caldi_25320 [Caldinitratiruptor microaerophilus]